MIDLVGKDRLISELDCDEVYLVGTDSARVLYVCKRDKDKLYFLHFTSALSMEFTKLVENMTYVRGIDKRTGKVFEELLDFSEVSIQELLYCKIPNFKRVDESRGYVREYLPHDIITIR